MVEKVGCIFDFCMFGHLEGTKIGPESGLNVWILCMDS